MKKANGMIAVGLIFAFAFTNVAVHGWADGRPSVTKDERSPVSTKETVAPDVEKAGKEKPESFKPVAIAGKSADETEVKKKKFPWLIVGGAVVAGAAVAVLLLTKKKNSSSATKGNIQVESTPTGAKIYLDGSDTGKTTNSTIYDVAAGTHSVKLVLPGFDDYEQSVTVKGGQTVTVTAIFNLKEIEMIRVPGGTFMMGSDSSEAELDEKPVHQVTVSSFEIGKYEVTQAEWEAVMGSKPSSFAGSRLPVERVNWIDVQEFIQKLNQMTGKNYRLPTEAEWEYACRAGSTGDRYGPIDSIAWYHNNSGDKTHEVGLLAPNAFGLYDMLGNVWEWVADWYGPYSPGAEINPKGPSSGTSRLNRGGSWGGILGSVRASNRFDDRATTRASSTGFRLARD
jgi:formylglycine-generating enzyme required for sulfatase activity